MPGRAPVWFVQHALDPGRVDQADLQMKVSIATSWSWHHRTRQAVEWRECACKVGFKTVGSFNTQQP
jgi:hypothetical protein